MNKPGKDSKQDNKRRRMNNKTANLIILTCSVLVLLPVQLQALPEDAEQPINITYDRSLLLLDDGREIYYGSPAVITQGTLKITGQEITIERIDGEVNQITVTGNLAHYEQQPAIDQAVVTAEAETITLDYDAQHVSAIGRAKFTQGNDQWTACQVNYYLENRQLSTSGCPDGSQAEVILAPRNNQ